MDRQAFRNRMQQLKQYREQNPGKTYLDFKKYAEGGEIPPSNKPIIPEEPQPYKGKLYKDRYGRKYTEDQMNEYYDSSTDENILQGTEIKSYMNQFRNYLDQKGKLNRGNYTGSYKNLKKEIIDAPKESFNNIKAIFNLYRSPKLFNKDFQMIPIVNNTNDNTIA